MLKNIDWKNILTIAIVALVVVLAVYYGMDYLAKRKALAEVNGAGGTDAIAVEIPTTAPNDIVV